MTSSFVLAERNSAVCCLVFCWSKLAQAHWVIRADLWCVLLTFRSVALLRNCVHSFRKSSCLLGSSISDDAEIHQGSCVNNGTPHSFQIMATVECVDSDADQSGRTRSDSKRLEPWKRHIIGQLKHRDQTQKIRFQDLVCSCRLMLFYWVEPL